MSSTMRRILRDCRGAVLVEFAFVAAPFFALIFATLITALITFAQQALDTSAEAVAREIMTGQVQKGSVKVIDPVTNNAVNIDSNARLKARVCEKISANGVGFLDCTKVMVSLKKLATFSAANQQSCHPQFRSHHQGGHQRAEPFRRHRPGRDRAGLGLLPLA